LGQAC